MIQVHRLNNESFFLNADRIEFMEETPDTVVSMESGRKFVVVESAEDIRKLIVEYRKQIYLDIPHVK